MNNLRIYSSLGTETARLNRNQDIIVKTDVSELHSL